MASKKNKGLGTMALFGLGLGFVLFSSFKNKAGATDTGGIKIPDETDNGAGLGSGVTDPNAGGSTSQQGSIKTYAQMLAMFTGLPECSNYSNWETCINQDDSQTTPTGTNPNEAMYYYNFGGLTRTANSTYWAGETKEQTPSFSSGGVVYSYRAFKNAFYGVAAVIYNISHYFTTRNLNTLQKIGQTWTGGANTTSWVNNLSSLTGYSPNFAIPYTKDNLMKIVMGVIIAENVKSKSYIDPKTFDFAYKIVQTQYNAKLPTS